MKKVIFKRIRIENFGTIEYLSKDLNQRTLVCGKNAVGKSTVKKAIQYVLNARDENGKEISGIRPHDEKGVDIDGLVTSVELTVSVDGAENTLRKEFYQKKNKKGEYTGEDATEYYIDDVKKGAKKAYDEFVSTLIPHEVCFNASTMLEKDTAGRRAMLSVFSKHTADDIIAENPQFQPIAGKVKANSVADLKKALREKINGSKNKNGLNDELKRIGVQIEVEGSKKRDIDVAELELHRNSIKEQIAEIEAKEADISKQFEEYQKLSDGVLELKFELNDLQRKANEELVHKKKELQTQIDEKNEYLLKISNGIQRNNREIAGYENDIENGTRERNRLAELWKSVNAETFDESTTICPTCHRELPADEIESLRSGFEQSKVERLAKIEKGGLEAKQDIENAKSMIPKLQECNKDNLANKEKLEKEVAEFEKQLSEIPQSINISDTEEYKAIQSQIVEKEAAMQKMNSADAIRQDLKESKSELQSQLTEVNTQIALAEENVKIDERISELQTKQREVTQQIADVECEIDLLKDYERKTAEALERDVNEYFEFATVKMFDEYKDGSLKDICEFYVDGTPYSKGLNYSNRLLVEVDIAKAFQKKHDICAPILLDNAESIDSNRIPNIENQLIVFQRTDDEKLTLSEGV